MALKKIRLTRTWKSLPREAFAIIGNAENPETWLLPHHRRSVSRAARGNLDVEDTVDWEKMMLAVAALLARRHHSSGLDVTPQEILEAARHLAAHYQKAGKPLPDILAALI